MVLSPAPNGCAAEVHGARTVHQAGPVHAALFILWRRAWQFGLLLVSLEVIFKTWDRG